jgi:hypothetical protein
VNHEDLKDREDKTIGIFFEVFVVFAVQFSYHILDLCMANASRSAGGDSLVASLGL